MTYFPIKSMTAYGRAKKSFEIGTFCIELQSVNRRFLEISCYLPRRFSKFEQKIRNQLSKKIGRGMVSVSLRFEPSEQSGLGIQPNLALAKELKAAWLQIATTIGYQGEIDLSLIAMHKEILVIDEQRGQDSDLLIYLNEVLDEACLSFSKMKEQEGEVLQTDLSQRLARLVDLTAQISVLSPRVTENYRTKLHARLTQVLDSITEDDERLLKEIAIFADKTDITEELVRLRSHLEKMGLLFTQKLHKQTDVIGKKIEFFVQEITREFNTIGSKAQDQEILHLVVEAKAEIEKIREQAQNIE